MAKPRCVISVEIYDNGKMIAKTDGNATMEELIDALIVINKQIVTVLQKMGYLSSSVVVDTLTVNGKEVRLT